MIGGIFVDGASMAFALQKRGTIGMPDRIQYASLLDALHWMTSPDGVKVVDFKFRNYYGTHRHEQDLIKKERFYRQLRREGWMVTDIQSKKYSDGHYEDKQVDLEMALDAFYLALLKQVKVLVVMTHDADFAALLKRLPNDVTGYVVGWRRGMARELKECAKTIFMEDIWDRVKYE